MNKNIDNLVNFNINSKNNEIKRVYGYIFEQIVSLYSYTVRNFNSDRKNSDFFTQQMRFTGAVTKALSNNYTSNSERDKEKKNKISYVLSLLDKGDSALEILETIKNKDSLLSKYDVLQVERAMEDNSILFSHSYIEHPYSFQAMYSILKNPLLIFQRFLYLPDPEELLNIVIKCRLEKKIDRKELLGKDTDEFSLHRMQRFSFSNIYSPLTFGHVVKSYNDQEVTLDLLLEACSDGRINLDKSDFTELIMRSIDDVLEEWSSWVLELLFPTRSTYPQPRIDSLIDGVLFKQEGIIKLNKEVLETLCLLGQTKQISDMLSKKIKGLYVTNEKEKEKILNMDTSKLGGIAKWHRNCRMGYITEVSQIPSALSALLYNRLEYGAFYEYVMCSGNEIIALPEKNKVDSLQQLTTFLIKKYLYHEDLHPSLPYKYTISIHEAVSTIDEYLNLEKFNESNLLPNLSMVDWISYNKTKTRDRFKRPIKKFNTGIFEAKSRIEKQKQEGIHHYFPVSNNYPLPFWAMK
ncbi:MULTISPECIES: hypothetical protein [unclassified Photobacterium]|uniref:hypothetical protein n=1 Tax=unclassified Photobacterium TaxID=2628852 RepID=UPI001EE08DA0|nr:MULTISPECIES: hypothetical protein [unclassified Photobacterium]MCG3865791.1 hypothetical protein [Photobacterium sp. Ph6]MCG3877266.1 hypothetical protein [Photobacterium sp. Ph5]